MGLQTSLQLNGLPGFLAAMADADQAARTAAAAALLPVAQQFCPVGPDRAGHEHMRDQHALAQDDPAAVSVPVDYAVLVHEGTTRMAARPWLLWAVDAQHEADVARFSAVPATAAARAGGMP